MKLKIQVPSEFSDIKDATTLEVIYTFDDNEQCLSCLPFFGFASEAEVIFRVLSQLSEAERQSLVKLSLCQYANRKKQFWNWLNESNGKYYFTPAPDATEGAEHE